MLANERSEQLQPIPRRAASRMHLDGEGRPYNLLRNALDLFRFHPDFEGRLGWAQYVAESDWWLPFPTLFGCWPWGSNRHDELNPIAFDPNRATEIVAGAGIWLRSFGIDLPPKEVHAAMIAACDYGPNFNEGGEPGSHWKIRPLMETFDDE